MTHESEILTVLNRLPTSIAATFVVACVLTVVLYYVGVPGFALLDGNYVGALCFSALLGVLIIATKLLISRRKTFRVKRAFSKLTDQQRSFLLNIHGSGQTWFKGYMEGEEWFEELRQLRYIQLSRPMILVPGAPSNFEIATGASHILSKAQRRKSASA